MNSQELRKMADTDTAIETPSEAERVEAWRLTQLLDADYPVELAEQLAARIDVDLHRAVEVVAGGCAHATAAEILL